MSLTAQHLDTFRALPQWQQVGLVLLVPESARDLAPLIGQTDDTQVNFILDAINATLEGGSRVTWNAIVSALSNCVVARGYSRWDATGVELLTAIAGGVPDELNEYARMLIRTYGV